MEGAALQIDRTPRGAEHFCLPRTGSDREADHHVVRGISRDPEQFLDLLLVERRRSFFPCFGDGNGTFDAGLRASSS